MLGLERAKSLPQPWRFCYFRLEKRGKRKEEKGKRKEEREKRKESLEAIESLETQHRLSLRFTPYLYIAAM